MSAIENAIQEVRNRIPKQILQVVFTNRDSQWRLNSTSIEEQIMALVIRPRVLVQCNLVGGAEMLIPLEGLPYDRISDYEVVYRIPKDRTQGRSIISVLNLTFSDPSRLSSYGTIPNLNASAMLQLGSAVMDAMGTIPMTSTATCQLVGENVVLVRDRIVIPASSYLRCVVAHDENMSHLQVKSYRAFADLVVLAVKAFIYNDYVIQMDVGELLGGQQLGKFKEIVDSYADADELFRTMLTEKWAKISLMNDQISFTRLIKMRIGSSR